MSDDAPPAATPASPVAATATYHAVLVTLDGSDDAERALAPATWLATHFNADLHVLVAGVRRDERLWYEHYLESIVERFPGTVSHCVADVDVVRSIRDAARQLDRCLVCVATHGRSRSAAVLGSTFAALAAASQEPLVAVGPHAVPRATPDPRRIVACLDGGPASEQLVPVTGAWARALGYDLSLLTVTRSGGDTASDHLHRLAGSPELDGLGVDPVVLRSSSSAHAAVLGHLDERPASLLAVTTHARSNLRRALVGSEAARIIHDSPVPVLAQPIPPD
jgi:nucleotide-binding universal stress UspA family protein